MLMKGHERDDVPRGRRDTDSFPGTFHSMVSVSGGCCPASTRWRNIERVTLEHVQFDMAMTSLRARLRREWWWRCGRKGAKEVGGKGRGRMQGVKSQIFGRSAVKNEGARLPALNVGPNECTCPCVTGALLRDTSILAGPWCLNHPCSIPSNRLVRHNVQGTCTARTAHVAHDYLNGTI
jgi:hypothetical protein